jgi:hypothetical protein
MTSLEFEKVVDDHILDRYGIKDKNMRARIVRYYCESLHIYCELSKVFIKEKDKTHRDELKGAIESFEKECLGPDMMDWSSRNK